MGGRAIDMLNPPVRVRGSNQFDTQLSQLALELRLGQLSTALCKSTLTNSSSRCRDLDDLRFWRLLNQHRSTSPISDRPG